MRTDLQKLFHDADIMGREELGSFRELLQDYSELVSLMEENRKAETEMAIQYQEMKDFRRNGFVLPRQVMTMWFIRFAVERFMPVYEYLTVLQLAGGWSIYFKSETHFKIPPILEKK